MSQSTQSLFFSFFTFSYVHYTVRRADGLRFNPDDVAGKVADLVDAQRDARAQVVLLREADALVFSSLEQLSSLRPPVGARPVSLG